MEFVKDNIWKILIVLNYVLAIAAVITVLFKKINPTKTLTYIIVLLVFPFIGLIVYYLFGQEYRKTKIFNRKKVLNQSVIKNIQNTIDLNSKEKEEIKKRLKEKSKLIPLLHNSENSHISLNNKVEIIKDGDDKFRRLFEDIKNAEHHIHLEYFIVKDDTIGTKLLNLLIEKASQSVEVRLVVDDVGSDISNKMLKSLKENNVYVQKFMPVLFSKSTGKMNYRDHRKIVIIDGKIGYVGGINVSDDYVNENNTAYFRDTHCRLEGDAVKQLQILFLTTYDFVTEEDITVKKEYFPEINNSKGIAVQIAASGPDTDWANILEALFVAITNATNYIYITTPYFIPNDEIVTALQVAARSDVKVKILVPKKSDSWIAEHATNSYLQRLLEADVEVYRYTKGFIHSKTMVVDDIFSSIGTANMDYRSFNINFEVNALVYDKNVASTIKCLFSEDLETSERLKLETWKSRSKSIKTKEAIANLMAPLL